MAADYMRIEVLPVREHTLVGLHLRTGHRPLEAIALEPADEIVEDEGIGTLATVLGQHADEQQVAVLATSSCPRIR